MCTTDASTESIEHEAWDKYFEFKKNIFKIKNVDQRLWHPRFGHPTLLQLAVYSNHEEFVESLLMYKANVNIITEVWGTALHVAVREKRFELTERLLDVDAAFDKFASIDNCTPIYYLVKAGEEINDLGELKILKKFLVKGLNIDEICMKPLLKPALTPLEVAIEHNIRAAKMLLNFGASVDRENELTMTPLESAISEEMRGLIMKHVIKLKVAGLPVSDKNWEIVLKNPPREFDQLKSECEKIFEAMKTQVDSIIGFSYDQVLSRSEKELVLFKRLLVSHMDEFCEKVRSDFPVYSEMLVNRAWKVRSIISPAHQRELKEKYLVLKKNFDDITVADGRQDFEKFGNPTMLQLAIFYRDVQFALKLLDKHPVDVNFVTEVWGTALHIAVKSRILLITHKLVEAGANINALGSIHNCTPIYHILESDRTYWVLMMWIFLKFGLDLNEACLKYSEPGLTPLEVAITYGYKSIVQSLLELGADVNRVGVNDMTPIELAESVKTLQKPWQFINVIKRHIIKLIAADLPVSERNRDSVNKFFKGYLEKCTSEVQAMKIVRIEETQVFYDDLLRKPDEELVDLFRIDDQIGTFRVTIEKMFPNYAEILVNRVTAVKSKVPYKI